MSKSSEFRLQPLGCRGESDKPKAELALSRLCENAENTPNFSWGMFQLRLRRGQGWSSVFVYLSSISPARWMKDRGKQRFV